MHQWSGWRATGAVPEACVSWCGTAENAKQPWRQPAAAPRASAGLAAPASPPSQPRSSGVAHTERKPSSKVIPVSPPSSSITM